jgi:hypothetical protein
MVRRRLSNVFLGGPCMLALLLLGSSMARAESGNLPIYTSPIDATGTRLQLRVAAPHRDTQQLVDVALPVGLLGPKMNRIFTTPLSTQMDQFWLSPDPKTGVIPRQAACDGTPAMGGKPAKEGIKQTVTKEVAKIGSSYRAYDIECNLATTGQLLVQQSGSALTLAYQLTNNTVTFRATSPYTCNPNVPGPCPNDPRLVVHFATQIVTVVRTPSFCQISTDTPAKIYVVAASIEGDNAAADIARFLKADKFIAAEVAITNTVKDMDLPLDDSFKELRESPACTDRIPGVSRVFNALRPPETQIDLRNRAIVLRAVHVGIRPPQVGAPNPGGPVTYPSTPSFTRPEISLSQPFVQAGNTVQVRGQHFPPNTNMSRFLPVSMLHNGGYANNSSMPVCAGGGTDLQWGPVGRQLGMQRIQGDAQGRCPQHFDATNLTPTTAYLFRARDCDPITCSPWSAPIRVITARADAAPGRVFLSLDSGVRARWPGRPRTAPQLGIATTDANGNFVGTVTIPRGTPAGRHTIFAVSGIAKTSENFQVTAATPGTVSKASMMMVFANPGEAGCPNRPILSAGTDDTFMLFGSGFAPGAVTVHLDSAAGAVLGTATVRADATFCGQMRSVPRAQAGKHTLVAVQNGAVVSQLATEFVPPSVIH